MHFVRRRFGQLLWDSVEIAQNRRRTKCTERASKKIRPSKRLELYIFQKVELRREEKKCLSLSIQAMSSLGLIHLAASILSHLRERESWGDSPGWWLGVEEFRRFTVGFFAVITAQKFRCLHQCAPPSMGVGLE